MNNVNSRLNRTDYIYLAIVLTIAVATRVYQLGDASFWLDELASISVASLPMSNEG